jgi:hypothetical protein
MRKFILVLMVFIAFACQNMFAQAIMNFENTSHDFGAFYENVRQSCVFKFTNTGTEPLVIHQAITSCGCTVADFTKTPIQPGKTGEVSVMYDGSGKLYGPFKKTITVRSNAKPTISRIIILGTMLEKKEEKK